MKRRTSRAFSALKTMARGVSDFLAGEPGKDPRQEHVEFLLDEVRAAEAGWRATAALLETAQRRADEAEEALSGGLARIAWYVDQVQCSDHPPVEEGRLRRSAGTLSCPACAYADGVSAARAVFLSRVVPAGRRPEDATVKPVDNEQVPT